METFSTIQQAFKNGTGDVFYKKDNQFIALSRHTVNHEEMTILGFDFIPYEDVIKLSYSDNTVESVVVWAAAQKARCEIGSLKKEYANRDNCYNGKDGYYDEFPDAYNQSL